MEIDNDVDDTGGEFVMYLDEEDIEEIINHENVRERIFLTHTKEVVDLTVTSDFGTFGRDKEKQHYDDVMEALEEIYRAFLVSEESTTVKELKNKNTVDIEKALNTYIYYRNIRQKYK